MKRKLLILFIAFLAIACNGQQSSKENVKPLTEQEALEAFKKQKHRFEIKGYKVYYNDQLMKLDTIANFFDTFGKPSYKEGYEFVYDNIPLWSRISLGEVKDKKGRFIGNVDRFFIYFRPYAEGREELSDLYPFYYAVKRMPEIDGYMLVEGHPIHKDTTPKELSEILKPIYGEHFVNLMGTPTIVFELKEDEIKEIIPHWGADKSYKNIFISFDYLIDEQTKKVIGLKSVDYSYFLL